MGYIIGEKFVCCDIGETVAIKPIDYDIPSETENQKYLNLLGKEVVKQFEREIIKKRKLKHEIDKIFNQRKPGRQRRQSNPIYEEYSGGTVETGSDEI